MSLDDYFARLAKYISKERDALALLETIQEHVKKTEDDKARIEVAYLDAVRDSRIAEAAFRKQITQLNAEKAQLIAQLNTPKSDRVLRTFRPANPSRKIIFRGGLPM
jgi:phage shock protein A